MDGGSGSGSNRGSDSGTAGGAGMSGTWRGFGWASGELPRVPLDDATREAAKLPGRCARWSRTR
ncbi:hypothetical protein SAV31267_034040 [Streptomyces avermitilis]|uniref:Uncharacterized protein n=1 Tax=Streptomyces avermitilis TaxID=33903 RepID=A0A4D4MRC0_STRAX|nr:hypothetical protein SAV31267_034040 [Streptomyces avermitilis]